jgi:hypothetical protein
MQTVGIATRIKCRLHDRFVGEVLTRNMTRHDLKKVTRRSVSRTEWNRLIAGPTQFPQSIDKLELIVRRLGSDDLDDGSSVLAGARQLPTRHAVQLSA